MKLFRTLGATSQILQVFIADSSSITGAGLPGLAFGTSGLTAYYHRDTDTTATAISLVTMTVGTFTSSGFKEIDSTNMPGWYQLGVPNAAFATGAASVALHLKGAANMVPLPIEIDLAGPGAIWDVTTASHTTSGTFGGGTITAPANFASLVISSGGVVESNVIDWNGTAVNGSIPPDVGMIRTGTAQNGTSNTITLDSGASATNNLYAGQVVVITSGTGHGQSAIIASYVGSTKVATINGTWATTPDPSSVFALIASGSPSISSNVKKNTASAGFIFPMTNSTTHVLQTGLTVTGTVSIDGASFVSLTNAVSEIGTSGIYTIDLAAADVNGNHIMLLFTASAADPRPIEIITQP